ncbi:ankyrin [Paraphaeosphaeria sporulosa]|uniref:Ankyrin n=1 Tax=Paraphaeosphaeria sporulosa TaxID=1460663 RepID=A0A177C9P7_9PLEO|nr:ankyrin [Paraphaeosphaeria sporulosa]OAG04373.1 ankyrin [Paraphaeosphaeria sporulosa]
MAACVGNLDISRVLLEAGACADYATLPYGYHELDNIWIGGWNANWSQTKYHSVSPEQSAIQIALERGDKAMFELLIQYGACLPNNRPCVCLRREDISLSRHILPAISGRADSKPLKPIPCPCRVDYEEACENDDNWMYKDCWAQKANESVWNPLFNAAKGKNRELFTRVLTAATTDQMPWMTTRCVVECIKAFDASFLDLLFSSKTCSRSPRVFRQLMLLAVKNNAQSALQDILQNHEFSAQDLGVGLAHAAVYLKERVIQAFLDAGSWPDDSVGAHIWPNGYPPLDKEEDTAYQISVLRHTLTIYNHPFAPIIYNHYQKFASRAQEPQLRTHFIQAYAIAIRCGDIHLGQMLAKAVGINAVLYRALPTLVPNEDRCYVSAVRLAVRFKRYDFVDWLLENGAEVEIATNSSHGPLAHSSLQIASKDGKISLVGTLLNKSADVNARPAKYHGATALQFAAMNGHFEIANLLINAGADLTAPPGVFEGRSAIEGAAEAGRMDMARPTIGGPYLGRGSTVITLSLR